MTIVDVVRAAAERQPDALAYRYLEDGTTQSASLTYGELDRQAVAVATAVAGRSAPRDRVALVLGPGLAFVPAFLGVLYAGRVAVPVAAPIGGTGSVDGLRRILADADPALALSDLAEAGDWVGATPLVDVATLPEPDASWTVPRPVDGDLAFLQYTSGSTGAPKGVMVTHGNLLANQEQIGRVFAGTPDDVVVSWLPAYHDMGLIGGVLHPLWLGATAVLMPPSAFLRRPLRWLEAIGRYRGTISPAPDFAYELCVRTAARQGVPEGLDLRSWQVACNGSEPVRATTMRAFADAFREAGFRPGAFAPCYGMAEATLIVSGVPRGCGGGLAEGSGAVSCGPAVTDEVVVVRDGAPVPEGDEGEICVRGPNVAAGYWRNPAATDAVFGFRVGGRPYLRTGDLGFVRAGAVHVTGRSKDLLVVRGRNHHPADVEVTVQGVDPRLMPGAGAAFTVGDDVVVVQAVRTPHTGLADLADAVRAAVVAEHGLAVDVVLVRPGVVPRTTSGKVRRAECRRRYLAGDMTALQAHAAAPQHTPPASSDAATDAPLRNLVADVLDCSAATLRASRPLTAQGLDSLGALRLQQELVDAYGVEVPVSTLLAGATLDTLRPLLTHGPAGGPSSAASAEVALPPSGMTRGQEALAFLSGFGGRAAVDYTIARSVRLPADVDPAAFAAVVEQVVARHHQLRSRFVDGPRGMSRQEWPAQAHTWCALRRLEPGEDLAAAVAAVLDTPLTLDAGPLLRGDVLVGPHGTAVLALRASHLVLDMHALALLATEIVTAYRSGTTAGLPPPAPFDAVLREEAAFLDSPRARTAAAAVAARLAATPDVHWPVPPPGGDPSEPATAAVTVRLDEEMTAAVHALAVSCGTTPFAVLLGAYVTFLAQLWGHDDVVVGVPFAARDGAARHRVVGYLVNTLPVHVRVVPGSSLQETVAAARGALLAALDDARVPLPVAVAQLRSARQDAPVSFHAMFDLLGDPFPQTHGLGAAALDLDGSAVRVGDMLLEPYLAAAPRPLADLDVAFTHVGDALVGRFAFLTSAFDVDSGGLLAGHFTDLLRRMLDDPSSPVRPAPPTGGSVLVPADEPVEPVTLGDLFAAQVVRTPDAVALVNGGRRWTYRDLDAWAERVARHLGAVPPSPAVRTPLVGVLCDDAVDFLAVFLAAARRGYGTVPLPPDFPDERLAHMAADCGVGVVAGPAALAERAAGISRPGCRFVAVPPWEPSAGDGGTGSVPSGTGSPHDVAYVVYTSGSTGRPKAVPITHAQVHPLLHWQVEGLRAGPGMRLAQTLALSFDFGLQELMTTVLFGGTLCVPDRAERFAPQAYGTFLRRDRVTTLFATPTFVRGLVAQGVDLSGITLLVLGGEMLAPATVRAVLPLLAPQCRVINGYGPTEASINCTMHTVDLSRDERSAVLPVGSATGASRVYVLDARRQVLPVGLVGEVWVGGPGVADGYIDRPEETSARFVPDTVTGAGRMYRTGDLGRVVDGELVLLGRTDHQLKIRGYRVELGEIEAVLRASPGVEDAVVLVDRAGPSAALAAFVTGRPQPLPELRAALRRRLPAYMLPASVVHVPSLPRTAHGKLDERTLLALARQREGTGPPTEVQAGITRIWRDVLEVDDIHLDANFFELGGHSLVVATVADRLGKAFGLPPLPLPSVFEHPTVRLLADHVQSLLASAGSDASRPAPLATVRRVRGRQRGLSHGPSTAPPRSGP